MIFLFLIDAVLVIFSFLAGFSVGDGFKSKCKSRKRDVEEARKALKNIARAVDTNSLYLVDDPVASPLIDDIRSEIRNYYEGIA